MTTLLISPDRLLRPHLAMPPQCRTRSVSPSPSVCSRATSIDDISEMERIDKMRPMYHSGSSLEERFGPGPGPGPGPGSSHSSHLNGFEDKAGSSSKMKMAIRSSHPDTIDVRMDEVQGEVIKSKRRFVEEEDEEILRESNDRFVLFPIKYHEVSAASPSSSTRRAARSFKVRECPLTVSDLEGVQSRTSRVLDCRGTRSRTRSP